MTELDAELPELALELIEEFGKLISYTIVGAGGAYNPATSSRASGAGQPFDVKAIVEDFKFQDYSAGLIEAGDKKLTIAARSFPTPPTPSDKAAWGGARYNVVAVKETNSGELAVIYELQVRK
jgi:hypothetical protein